MLKEIDLRINPDAPFGSSLKVASGAPARILKEFFLGMSPESTHKVLREKFPGKYWEMKY